MKRQLVTCMVCRQTYRGSSHDCPYSGVQHREKHVALEAAIAALEARLLAAINDKLLPGGVPKSPGAIPRTSDVKHDRNCGYGMLEDSDWQDCTCHVHAARKAKRSGAKTDCENCHGTGKWHDIVFDEERQCPCVNGEAMKLPRTKEPLMPVPPVPDDVNSRLAAAARIDTQTGQRPNDAVLYNIGDRVITTDQVLLEHRGCFGEVVAIEAPEVCVELDREDRKRIWVRPAAVRPAPIPRSDSARTCEDCEDAPAILCRSCVKHACEVAVDHLVDSEGREHCWGCLRGDRRKCPGMPRTEPGMVDPTRSSKDRALAIWDNEKGGTDAEFILAMAASFDALRKETIKECVKEAWGASQGSCPYACTAYVAESLEGMLTGSTEKRG